MARARTSVDRSTETERGFICRAFYDRGGRTIPELFVEAKSIGVDSSWFSDASSRIVWKSVEDIFKTDEFKSINLFKICKRANAIAHNSRDYEEQTVEINKEFFDESQKLVRGTDDFAAYINLLRDNMMVRRTKELVGETQEAIVGGDDAVSTLSRMIAKAQEIIRSEKPRNKVSLSEQLDEIIADYEKAYKEMVVDGNIDYTPGIPLPWRKVAFAINGFTTGVHVLAARPGVGKTSLALNFTRYWLDMGYHVVFNSVDMDAKSFLSRQLSEKAGIGSRKMKFARFDSEEEYNDCITRLKEQAKTLKELDENEKFSLYSEYDIDALKANCTILKDQGKIDVLIVDYLQLMKFKGCDRLPPNQRATYISNELHSLTVELKIPVLCLSQLNRDNTKDGGREPLLSDLRDSGAIEQDATSVMLLHRYDALWNRWRGDNPPLQYKGQNAPIEVLSSYCPIWMSIAKARDGECIKLPFVVIQNKMAWYQGDYKAGTSESDPKDEPKFARVYDDWRHAPWERIWDENGCLIKMEDVRRQEETQRLLAKKNAEWRETSQGRPQNDSLAFRGSNYNPVSYAPGNPLEGIPVQPVYDGLPLDQSGVLTDDPML